MQDSGAFTVRYCGPGVESGTINARDLATSLRGLSDAVEEAGAVVTHGEARIELHVRAGQRMGSFEIDLQLVQSMLDQFVDLFTSDHVIALSTLLGLLGISGFGVLQLLKRAKGRKPKHVLEVEETHRVRLTYDDEEIEVDSSVWNLSGRHRVQSGLAQLVSPLSPGIVDSISLKSKNTDPVTIEGNERPYFEAKHEHEEERVTESERVVELVDVSFKEGNKWRVSEGGSPFFVTIVDEEFYEGVKAGVERFSANDHLRVLLRTRQWMEDGDLKAKFEIVKILHHYTGDDLEDIPLPERA